MIIKYRKNSEWRIQVIDVHTLDDIDSVIFEKLNSIHKDSTTFSVIDIINIDINTFTDGYRVIVYYALSN